jgi:ornithine cyclodeaminase/alanine dehydrogenase
MALLLSRQDVESVLEMRDCMDVVVGAFLEMAKGTAKLPLRTNITSPDGISLYMPAYLEGMEALACKIVTVFKKNPEDFGLPVILGKVFLQDPKTGDIICIMDGTYLTAVRTGAASGVATKYLARKDKGQMLGIIGTGAQAEQQIRAVTAARDIDKILVYDKSWEASFGFQEEMAENTPFNIIIVDKPDDILYADIICTATSSPTPVFDGRKVRPGTHINGIGSHTPNARELDTEVIKKSMLVGDSRDACFNEAGDVIIPLKEGAIDESHFYAEMGEIVAGTRPGRTDADAITVFKSNGLAIQDAATAQLVYRKALEKGIGTTVEL